MIYRGNVGLYLSGSPVAVPMCAIYLVQPTVRQIIQLGETDFLMGCHILGKTEDFVYDVKQGNSQLETMSNFEILMILVKQQLDVRKFLDIFFELVCPEYTVRYTNKSIQLYLPSEKDDKKLSLKGQITPFNFKDFQDTVRELFVPASNGNEPEYNLANDKAREIYEKIKKGRERVQAEHGGNNSSGSLYGTYASILAIGLQMDINIFLDYTPFQITDAYMRYWSKVNYDFYRHVATTPLMDVSKMEEPEEWTRNLYDVDNS